MNPLDKFDPNANRATHPWATYCPFRGLSQFRTHKHRGHALNALHTHARGGGIIYELDANGRWAEMARLQPPSFLPDRCDGCGLDTMEHPRVWDRSVGMQVTDTSRKVNTAVQVFKRENGKVADPLQVLTLCPGCKQGMGY